MTKTFSEMLPLGSIAPNFKLKDIATDHFLLLNELKVDKGVVIMFICNHCPYVKHILDHLISTTERYKEKGITFLAINSNDVSNFPDDSSEKMKELIRSKKISFPYLFDETQEVAKEYHAACTPDFYLFNAKKECVYRGRYDESTPGNNISVSGSDLIKAMDQLINSKEIFQDQKPSVGCNIKWKN